MEGFVFCHRKANYGRRINVFLCCYRLLCRSVAGLIGANKQIQNAMIAADRLFEIMDLEQEESTEKMVLSKEKIGDIQFKNVNFRYGTRMEVFSDFNLTIPKGKITAIVDESGSEK